MEHKWFKSDLPCIGNVLKVEECVYCDTKKYTYMIETGTGEEDFDILSYLMTGRTQHMDRGCPTKLKQGEL